MTWKQYSLGDLGNFFGGVTSISKDDYGWGTPFLTYKNVFSNSKVDVSELALMNVKPADLQKRDCVYGDIFFTASSETPDEVAMSSVLLDEVDNLTFNGFTKRFRLHDFSTLLPGYARYLFRGRGFREAAYEAATGDVRFNISQESLAKILVSLPPLEEQRGIAATLGALDDKIESNQRVKQLTLELADSLFRSAVESEGRRVPLGDVADFHNRKRVPLSGRERESRVGPYPYYGATGVFGFVDDYLFDEILVLVGEDGSVVNDNGSPVTQYIWGKTWINNHAHPLTGRGISNELLFLALRASDVRPIVTGAVQPKISMGNLKSLVLALPDSGAQQELEQRLGALFAAYRKISDESKKLAELRNALQPALLVGHIRVPQAQGEAI